jgi:hypothetical protein
MKAAAVAYRSQGEQCSPSVPLPNRPTVRVTVSADSEGNLERENCRTKLAPASKKTATKGFTDAQKSWYLWLMDDSYLGIVTSRGLETFVLETEHAAAFLLRRARLHQASTSTCCWAVLDEDAAQAVSRWIKAQQFTEALKLLNLRAKHLGRMLPEITDDDPILAGPEFRRKEDG